MGIKKFGEMLGYTILPGRRILLLLLKANIEQILINNKAYLKFTLLNSMTSIDEMVEQLKKNNTIGKEFIRTSLLETGFNLSEK